MSASARIPRRGIVEETHQRDRPAIACPFYASPILTTPVAWRRRAIAMRHIRKRRPGAGRLDHMERVLPGGDG
jgi:hypothetical protein